MDLFKKQHDRAKKILDNANFWISNVDSKVSFIISFAGVFLGFIFTSDSTTESVQKYISTVGEINMNDFRIILSFIAIVLFILTIYFISISVYQLLKALRGRIDPKNFEQPGMEMESSIFWGTISSKDYATFKKSFDTSDEQHLNDLQSQAYINSLITNEKFNNYNKGLNSLKNGIILFIIFKLITYIPL